MDQSHVHHEEHVLIGVILFLSPPSDFFSTGLEAMTEATTKGSANMSASPMNLSVFKEHACAQLMSLLDSVREHGSPSQRGRTKLIPHPGGRTQSPRH